MRKKIFRVIIMTLGAVLLVIGLILLIQMSMMRSSIIEVSKKAGSRVEEMSKEAMSIQAKELLSESSVGRAGIADREFSEFLKAIDLIADSAEDIYLFKDRYGINEFRQYDEADMGEIVVYTAYGKDVDPEDESIKNEVDLISNMQGIMMAVNESTDSMVSDYFATESGIFLCAEAVSEYNVSKNGEPLFFEARERPWYIEAVREGKPVFTSIISDADTGKQALTCGIPVYTDGVLRGVAGAGLYLDTIREDVDNFHVGEKGYACIINNHGQILFSGSSKGELSVSEDMQADLRESPNAELKALALDAVSGKAGVSVIDLDGQEYYVAYAPMETVGWSYLTVLPEREVSEPSRNLVSELFRSNMEQRDFVRSSIFRSVVYTVVLLLVVALSVAFISKKFAERLAAPIVMLTKDVSALEGDTLDFSWDIDTGDEVQTLAKSFESMTGRMKQYIRDITAITAEKERIGAELSVATHIQASMLPSVFPPFPDRKEFELYAKMDPAKEVGGDFYDFFMVDDDHIALVIADVSGKGVPAALFMVIAKTLIKNYSKSGTSVEDIFIKTSDQLCEGNGEGLFVTAWIGIIDLNTGVMTYCDAGHEYPYVIHADGSIEILKPQKKKLPLAAMAGIQYISNEITLKKGDCLLLYTDGVLEATDADNRLYGPERLEAVLSDKWTDDTKTLLKDIRADVDDFVAGAPQFDDLTMLAFRLHKLTGEDGS
ncbi:MAG TPA: hypothetical protein DIS78_10485 [Lachnospiraceae bacterium]|nr:hypothetical protein [Lachnospiraceae bacterium]